MTEERKKHTAKTVRELYLYPYRSKGENMLRGGAWMASWIVGIVVQQAISPQVLGGAYIIFALSLLLEFVPESRTRFCARVVHSLFCTLLLIMLLGALALSFGNASAEGEEPHGPYAFLVEVLPYVGWAVSIMMLAGIILALAEVHRFFYDEKMKLQCDEESREATREQFLSNLEGPQKEEIHNEHSDCFFKCEGWQWKDNSCP